MAGHAGGQPRRVGVARVRARGGDERAGEQQRPEHGGATSPTSPRTAPGTTGRGGPSPSPTAETSTTASQTSAIETRKCTLTLHHTSPSSTVNPPITAWATTPSGCTSASRTSRGRRGRAFSAARKHSPVTSTTANVSSRLPNSTHWCSAATSGCGVGTRLPGKHCGQVGQPSPDPVTRTIDPVTAIPACATTAAIASRRTTAGGTGTRRSRSAGRATRRS